MSAEYHRKVLEIQQAISKRELHRLELEKELSRIRHRKEVGYDKLKMKLKSLMQELLSNDVLQSRKVELLFSRIEDQKKECDFIQKRTKQLRARKRHYDFRHSSDDSLDRKKDLYDTKIWMTPVKDASTQTELEMNITSPWTGQQLPPYLTFHPSLPIFYPGRSEQPIFNYSVLPTTSSDDLSNFIHTYEPLTAGVSRQVGLRADNSKNENVALPHRYQDAQHLDQLRNQSFVSNKTPNLLEANPQTTTGVFQTIPGRVDIASRAEPAGVNVFEPSQIVPRTLHNNLSTINMSGETGHYEGVHSIHQMCLVSELHNKQSLTSENDGNEAKVDLSKPESRLLEGESSTDGYKEATRDTSLVEEESTADLMTSNVKQMDFGKNENLTSSDEFSRDSKMSSAEGSLENRKEDTRSSKLRSNSGNLIFASFSPMNKKTATNTDKLNEKDNAMPYKPTTAEEKWTQKETEQATTTKEVSSTTEENFNLKPIQNYDSTKGHESSLVNGTPLSQLTEGKSVKKKFQENRESTPRDERSKVSVTPVHELETPTHALSNLSISEISKLKPIFIKLKTKMNENIPTSPKTVASTLNEKEGSTNSFSSPVQSSPVQRPEYARRENTYNNDKDFFDEYIPSKPTEAYRRMLGMIHNEPQSHSEGDDVRTQMKQSDMMPSKDNKGSSDIQNYDVESIDSVEAAIQAATSAQESKQAAAESGTPSKLIKPSPSVPTQPSTESTAPLPVEISTERKTSLATKGKLIPSSVKARPAVNDPLKISLDSESESLSMSAGALSEDDDDFDFYD